MKRTIFLMIAALVTLSAAAQPHSVGFRIGLSGFEAEYRHDIAKNQFIEGDFGLDFGNLKKVSPGIRLGAAYNFVWARPAWTHKGSWALYAGPGLTTGYANDEVHYTIGKEIISFLDNGFFIGLYGQVGLEYSFQFPLELSLDMRPVIGMHINSGYTDKKGTTYHSRTGFYDNGLLGLVPSLSIRYRF